jgi:RNA polymerase sigma-70 factor (ECF subfamily)
MTSEAISTLVERRRRRLFLQFVVRRVKDYTVAEDILQAAYARAFDQQSSLRSNDSVTAWFYRVLRNAIIDYYRRRDVEGRVLEPLSPEADRSAEPTNTASICHCIHRALDQIKPAYGQVLREVELTREVPGALNSYAKRSGITAGNAAVRAHRARRAVKRQLLKTCGPCAQAGCLNCSCA